jgi:hypothetical protein
MGGEYNRTRPSSVRTQITDYTLPPIFKTRPTGQKVIKIAGSHLAEPNAMWWNNARIGSE